MVIGPSCTRQRNKRPFRARTLPENRRGLDAAHPAPETGSDKRDPARMSAIRRIADHSCRDGAAGRRDRARRQHSRLRACPAGLLRDLGGRRGAESGDRGRSRPSTRHVDLSAKRADYFQPASGMTGDPDRPRIIHHARSIDAPSWRAS
jgi:hypothetical protein